MVKSADPLSQLEERIERARQAARPPAADRGRSRQAGGDPLQALRARIARARDPQGGPADYEALAEEAREPLAEMYRRIAEATDLQEPPAGAEASWESGTEAAGKTDDPMKRLAGAIAEEIEAVGARRSVLHNRGSEREGATRQPPSRSPGSEAGGLEATLGREVLDLLGGRPLSGDARREAVHQVVALLDAVERAEADRLRTDLRRLLGLLVTGQPD